MSTSEEIIAMKRNFAAAHDGLEANVLYITDSKWKLWWKELARVGNPYVDEKLSAAVGRKGFAAMKGRVWEGLRIERHNPDLHPGYRTFVDRVAEPEAVSAVAVSPARRCQHLED